MLEKLKRSGLLQKWMKGKKNVNEFELEQKECDDR
jgi:hypothetical protein